MSEMRFEHRMSDADAARTRAVLDAVVVRDAEQAARDLAALGLVDPHD